MERIQRKSSALLSTVLGKIWQCDVVTDPFPHFLIDDVFPEDVLAELKEHFKRIYHANNDRQEGNARFSIGLAEKYDEGSAEVIFQRYISSIINGPEFVKAILSKFNSFVPASKNFEELLHKSNFPVRSSQHELANLENNSESFSYDIQPGMNPLYFSGIEPHIDAHHKLIAGLLYIDLNTDGLDRGGALVLHQKADHTMYKGTTITPWHSAPPVKRVKYRDNRLVVLLNTASAIHSAEAFIPDTGNPYPRCLLNIIAESSTTNYLAYDPRKLPHTNADKAVYFLAGWAKLITTMTKTRLSRSWFKKTYPHKSLARIISDWKLVGFQEFQSARKILGL
jgi:hypothetical protein